MQRHILIHNKPTYFNIGDMEKIKFPTSKQTQNQTLIAEFNLVLKQYCGS